MIAESNGVATFLALKFTIKNKLGSLNYFYFRLLLTLKLMNCLLVLRVFGFSNVSIVLRLLRFLESLNTIKKNEKPSNTSKLEYLIHP